MAARWFGAAVVLGVGYWIVIQVGAMLKDPMPADIGTAPTAAPSFSAHPVVFDALNATMTDGRWEFVDGGWSLGVGSVAGKDVATYWSRTLSAAEPEGPTPDAWEKSVLDLVPTFRLAGKEAAGGARRIYSFDSPSLKAEIVTRPGGADARAEPERLIYARAAVLLEGERWSTLETARTDAARSGTKAGRLLPYPSAAELLAVRYGPQNQTIGEFSRVQGNIEQLVALWRKAGSAVTLNDAPARADFCEGFCRHDDRVLRLILWEPKSQCSTTVLVLDTAAGEAPSP